MRERWDSRRGLIRLALPYRATRPLSMESIVDVYALKGVKADGDSPSLVADVSDYVDPANRILWYCPNGQDVRRVMEHQWVYNKL